jgi:LPXTG-site transpeptidase (sortase) family protein
MRPSGTIYLSGKSDPLHGELILQLSKLLRGVYFFLKGAGIGSIFLAIYMASTSYGAMFVAEFTYRYKDYFSEKTDYQFIAYAAEAENTENIQNEAKTYGVSSEFSIVIPKIDAKSDIIANVDVSNEKEYYGALSKGVAHAKGTYFPGQNGRIFLFSHSTNSPLNFSKYNAIFYLLKKLEQDDDIVLYFADKRYDYVVTEKKVIPSDDVSWLTPKVGEEELVLMTCDPPGTSWKRLLVIAKPKNSN